MKETILGFPQRLALELGLSVTDIILYDIVVHSTQNDKMETVKHGGKVYTRIKYDATCDYVPVLGLRKRALANRLDKLCKVGLLEKYTSKELGLRTFFRIVTEKTKLRHADYQQSTNRINNPIKKKENNKKKEEIPDFNVGFAEFAERAREDEALAYNLRTYNIASATDIDALLEVFRKHLLEVFKAGAFLKESYERKRQWLVRAIKYLNIDFVSSVKLGKGEYLKDGKRYYIHPSGAEREVPLDAPPRQYTSQVWYVDEKRWGPQL